MTQWKPISELPEEYNTSKRMFLVKAISVDFGTVRNYTSDPWCVWMLSEGVVCARWPHSFKPTHFVELPQ